MHNLNHHHQHFSGSSNQFCFTPISRTFSNMGTTVSYSLTPSTDINTAHSHYGGATSVSAHNPNWVSTGNFSQYIHPSWHNVGYTTYNPMVSASHYNHYVGGSFTSPYGYFSGSKIVQPGIDVSETASDVVVTASVSNLGINNLNLNVTENSVTISGTAWTGSENIVLNRTVALPTSIRAESVDANFQSGVLEIRCPKTEKLTRQRTTIGTDSMQGVQPK